MCTLRATDSLCPVHFLSSFSYPAIPSVAVPWIVLTKKHNLASYSGSSCPVLRKAGFYVIQLGMSGRSRRVENGAGGNTPERHLLALLIDVQHSRKTSPSSIFSRCSTPFD